MLTDRGAETETPSWLVCIDTGGTFTDCLAWSPSGQLHRAKVLSNSALRGEIRERLDRQHYRLAARWGVPPGFLDGFAVRVLARPKPDPGTTAGSEEPPVCTVLAYDAAASVLEVAPRIDMPVGATVELVSPEQAPILAARLVTGTPRGHSLPPMRMRLATTRGTNALLERRGGSTAVFVTRGFGDLLLIGDQSRPDLFALEIRKPEPLYAAVLEVPERLNADGSILGPLDLAALAPQIRRLKEEGVSSAAVSLLHSYRNPVHERKLAEALRSAGFRNVSVSSELSPFLHYLSRTETAVVDAYLTPVLGGYISAVENSLGGGGSSLHLMTSAGGLVKAAEFRAKDSLLSGPAGGVVGMAAAGETPGFHRLIGFDMGGTSTDVSRFDGDFDYVFEHRVGGAHLRSTALAIETVAAGGGSICSFDGHSLTVGPESAGADPGPACYGAGGPLTLTDVQLLLGRLEPRHFGIPVQRAAAEAALQALKQRMVDAGVSPPEDERLLPGFLTIANERMAEAVRTVSVRQGYDPASYCLVAFGGAGGQHACAVAAQLGVETVLAPPDAGLLSAAGLQRARVERFAGRHVLQLLREVEGRLDGWLADLGREACEAVEREGCPPGSARVRRQMVHLRLLGQESSLVVEPDGASGLAEAFAARYESIYGHRPEGRPIEVESLQVVASAPPAADAANEPAIAPLLEAPEAAAPAWFDGGWRDTLRVRRDALAPQKRIAGPAVVYDAHSAFVIEPGWTAQALPSGGLLVERSAEKAGQSEAAEGTSGSNTGGETPGGPLSLPDSDATSNRSVAQGGASRDLLAAADPIQLELFTNRFVVIARNMGETMRRTALSTNIKERLDFSCALLDAHGEIVVNAPHIPVHLGALGLCVRRMAETLSMQPGDVVVTNHPAYGGSHLPDVTVITPVFAETETDELLGYLATRAHHAEIGGSRPGSMPPAARRLVEEGVVIEPQHLLHRGGADWGRIERLLGSGPYPSRAPAENLADLRAATAANLQGARGLLALAREHGADTVRRYMAALTARSERQMVDALRQLSDGRYEAAEQLDDGSPIRVRLEIDGGTAAIDFTGSAPLHPGNLNAVPAIVRSAVMYVLRILVAAPVPLNEGLMRPVTVTIPPGMLNPPFSMDPPDAPAVVGGNVETSQRIVDTLLKALKLAACSQGTMNNVVFGNESFGYYETIGGGTGAGPGFTGASAVHSHMTNTRMTDAEVLEHRYPVRLERFAVRRGSGGRGQWSGGDGIIREYTFLAPIALSLFTQHRLIAPYGGAGGLPGAVGRQRLIRAGGEVIALGPIDEVDAQEGDRLIVETPGGGGWGLPLTAPAVGDSK